MGSWQAGMYRMAALPPYPMSRGSPAGGQARACHLHSEYGARVSSPFLKVPESEWVASNARGFAIRDRYPGTRIN